MDPDDPGLSVSRQCQILGVSRSAYYYEPQPEADRDELELLGAILDILGEIPFFGYRKVTLRLKENGHEVTRKQVPNRQHPKYPYLLRNKVIWLPNQVWATDITYIRLKGGHVHLVAIIDLYSRGDRPLGHPSDL